VYAGGTTATNIDFASALTSKLPLFLVIIAGLGFLLLTLAFRSLLVPAIGAIGNLLTIAVALGSTMMKLNARDRAQLVVIAYETGLITPGRKPD
jgi:uncharacterized membrane protein YdfJ with MMPL/SSD domain